MFPLASGPKEIRMQSVENFEQQVQIDERDSNSIKDIVDKFETDTKKSEISADVGIAVRYVGSVACATSLGVAAFVAAPVTVPVALALAGMCTIPSFVGLMGTSPTVRKLREMFHRFDNSE